MVLLSYRLCKRERDKEWRLLSALELDHEGGFLALLW